MTFTVLRALNPFAGSSDAATSRRIARMGGGAGLILAALSAWGALALYLKREAFLADYAASLPAHPDPAVAAMAESMGPAMLNMAMGFQILFAAVLAVAAFIQFRRGGWVPLALFALFALFDLWSLTAAFIQGVPTDQIAWPVIRLLLILLALTWTVTAFRAAFASRSASQPSA